HDDWYDSGFDEAAGNAQTDNFGRGGAGGDPIHAESQDFDGLNNANMAVPSDGMAPRMQMFSWAPPEVRALSTSAGDELETASADFGPQEFEVSGPLALADDGTAPGSDACQPLGGAVAGTIVLVDRGGCSFSLKAKAAEIAGATAIL